jgi:winged helix-turn-helix protein
MSFPLHVREWLNGQAAGAYVEYAPDSGRYTLPAEHAIALTDESSPAYMPGFFQIALGSCISHWCCQAGSGSVERTLIKRTECLPAGWHFRPNLPDGIRQLLSGG